MADADAVERTLAAARAAMVAPTAARERLRAGLRASGAYDAATPSAGAAVLRKGVAKSTAGMLLALGLAAGYWLGRQHTSDAVPEPTPLALVGPAQAPGGAAPPVERTQRGTDPAQSLVTPRSIANPASDLSTPAMPAAPEGTGHTRPRTRRLANASAATSASADRLAEELALLQRAERALRVGETELVLSFVRELERRYPHSTLTEERTAIRIMAECMGGAADSRRQAELFLRDRRASLYTDRVRRVCELSPSVQLPEADGSRSPGH
jgi:hypothetical protein